MLAATFATRDAFFMGEQRIGEMEHVYGLSTWPEWQHHLRESGFVELRTYNGYGPWQTEQFGGARMLVSGRPGECLLAASPPARRRTAR